MREDRERHEPRSRQCSEQPETENEMIAWMDGYDQGYEEGLQAARLEFAQTQLLLLHTGGSA
jgi:hypothetical protein